MWSAWRASSTLGVPSGESVSSQPACQISDGGIHTNPLLPHAAAPATAAYKVQVWSLRGLCTLTSYIIPLYCRFGFIDNLTLGGPTPLGARAANLTEMTRPFMEEIALNEQGHALFTRQAGSTIPCPLVDFDGGFNDFMAAAYGLADGVTVEQQYGSAYGMLLTLLSILIVTPLDPDATTANCPDAGVDVM